MKAFLCWCDDGGDVGDNAVEYYAYDTSAAAQECAEREFDESAGENCDEQVIHVRDETGAWHVFDVQTECRPMFIARKRP